ncbi:MAG: transglycosylase domain-containing protein [bacterium]|nr:transglycosylase domain-containing protein [bacterium]
MENNSFNPDDFRIDNIINNLENNDDNDIFNTSEFSVGKTENNNFEDVVNEPQERGLWSKIKSFFKPKSSGDKKLSKAEKKAKIVRTVLSVFLVFVITGCLIVGSFTVYVFGFVDDKIHENLDDLTLDYTTTVYVKDSESNEYVEYQRLHGGENRIWISLEKMPQDLRDAFVAIEDKRFYKHNGVDWKRTVSAFVNMFANYYSSNQGGSTITQQLVKNLTGDNQQTPIRKIREIMRARYLEDNYSKDTILECYLNTICLANGIYGVEVASNYYFDKSVSELTLSECAALAAMAKEPERYRPDTKPDNNKERRNIVLSEMKKQKLISKREYDSATQEELNVIATSETINEMTVNSYFIDSLYHQVVDDLVDEYGFDTKYAANNFYNGGYKIYCTLDPEIQTKMESVYKNVDKYFSQSSKTDASVKPESAMTVIDYDGNILGIVGGKGEKTKNLSLNRAWSSPRQPGSTMKPIGAYAPALEYNMITYSTLVNDSAISRFYDNGKSGPKNWYGYYGGNTTVQKALERSVNTIPCKLVQQLTVEKSFNFLTKNLGITTLDESNDKNLSSLGLGGCYYGITTTESAAAFATFGNFGRYYEPSTYEVVKNQHGETVLEKDTTPFSAMGEDTACIMNHLLRTVVTGSQGTGSGAASYSSMPVYAKTGTSSESNDLWFVGGTPYYVGSCWYGFDTPEEIRNGASALNIWKAVMRQLHTGLKYKTFEDSEYVVRRYYCAETGKLATSGCGNVAVGWYKTSYLPSTCSSHGGTVLGAVTGNGIPSSSSSGSGSSVTKPPSKPSQSSSQSSSGNSSSVVSSKPTESSAVSSGSSETVSDESSLLPSGSENNTSHESSQ